MTAIFATALGLIVTLVTLGFSWPLLKPSRPLLSLGIALGFVLLTMFVALLGDGLARSTGNYVLAGAFMTTFLAVQVVLPFALYYGIGGPPQNASWSRTSLVIVGSALASMVLIFVAAITIFGLPAGAIQPFIVVAVLALVQMGVSFAVAGIVKGLADKPGLMWLAIIGVMLLIAMIAISLVVLTSAPSSSAGMIAPGLVFAIAIGFLIGLVIYFVPSAVALARNHPQKVPIIVLNILAGWTFLGWIGSLIWSLITPSTLNTPMSFAGPSEFAPRSAGRADFAPPPAPPARQRDIAGEIERLHRMMEQGMISREDYEKAKGKLLA